MKKFVILLFVAMAALSAKAQVYVGGTVALWHNDDLDATTFALNPEDRIQPERETGYRWCIDICTQQAG